MVAEDERKKLQMLKFSTKSGAMLSQISYRGNTETTISIKFIELEEKKGRVVRCLPGEFMHFLKSMQPLTTEKGKTLLLFGPKSYISRPGPSPI